MKATRTNSNHTDKAWEKLYKRLEEDELLATKPASPSRRWITAAILITATSFASLVYFFSASEEPRPQPVARTESHPIRTTILSDSSIVYLDDHASLTYPDAFADDVREVRLEGNAMFDVKGNPQHPFRIHIGQATVEVLGTSFYIQCKGTTLAEAGVKNGKIKITLPDLEQPIYIGKGERVTIQSKSRPATSVMDESIIHRYTRHLHFKDETLGHVLHVINRLKPEGIRFKASPDTEQRKLTFTYTDNSPETLAEMIATTLGIRFHTEGSTILFTE